MEGLPLSRMDELLQGLDPGMLGLGADAGIVAAVTEATNLVKNDFRSWGLDPVCSRFYPAIPFAVAFGIGLLMGHGLWSDALQYAMKIGLLSSFAWQAHRVSVKGK